VDSVLAALRWESTVAEAAVAEGSFGDGQLRPATVVGVCR